MFIIKNFCVLASICGLITASSFKPEIDVIGGVLKEPIIGAILPEAYVTMAFLVKLPNPPVLPKEINCTSLYTSLLCETLKNIEALNKFAIDEFFKINPYIGGSTFGSQRVKRSGGLFPFLGDGMSFVYGTATETEINNIHAEDKRIEQSIRDLAINNQKYLLNITHQEDLFHHKLEKSWNQNVRRLENITSAHYERSNKEMVGTLRAIGQLTSTVYADTIQSVIQSAAADCLDKRVPRSVISDYSLEKKLKEVKAQLDPLDYRIVVTPNQLINLKVTTCTFSAKRLRVFINVPVSRKDSILSAVNLIKAPFKFNASRDCIVSNAATKIIQRDYKGVQEIIPSEALLRSCSFRPDEPCMIPPTLSISEGLFPCTIALVRGSLDTVSSNCRIQCSEKSTPSVYPIGDTSFLITTVNPIKIECPNYEKTIRPMYAVGLLRVTIKCGCHITMYEEFGKVFKVLEPPHMCKSPVIKENIVVSHLVPASFTNLAYLQKRIDEPLKDSDLLAFPEIPNLERPEFEDKTIREMDILLRDNGGGFWHKAASHVAWTVLPILVITLVVLFCCILSQRRLRFSPLSMLPLMIGLANAQETTAASKNIFSKIQDILTIIKDTYTVGSIITTYGNTAFLLITLFFLWLSSRRIVAAEKREKERMAEARIRNLAATQLRRM